MKIYPSILFCLILFVDCRKPKQSTADSCNDQEGLFVNAAFPIGVAVNSDSLYMGGIYERIVNKQFNSITPENIFKPSFLHPHEHQYDWYRADALADYCLQNNKRLHGHTLIWHAQLPGWMESYEGVDKKWESMFRDHIQSIVKHFKGRIKSWDVVNEAFNEDGTLRETIWKEHIGSTYIEKAFLYAKEADPDVLLFYNDFLLEANSTKRKAVISYFNNLRARGVKIDGIGLQFHVSTLFPDISQIAETLRDFSDNKYRIHISELDISINPFYKDIEPGGELYEQQAELIGSIVTHYRQVPQDYQYGITFWGVNDANSWIPVNLGKEDYPLLYDAHYKPKPVYCKLKESL